MPNIKQQKRRVSIAARQRFENLRYRSTAKTLYKRLETAIADGDKDAAAQAHRDLVRCLDQAAAYARDAPEPRGAEEVAGRPARRGRLAPRCYSLGPGHELDEGALELELAGRACSTP